MKKSPTFVLSGLVVGTIMLTGAARADEPPVAPPVVTPRATPPVDLQAPSSTNRTKTLVPKPVYVPPTLDGARMQADPIADGALLGIGVGFLGLTTAIISTGELRPQQISPTFTSSQLLGIDRIAITQHVDPNAATISNVLLYAALSYSLIDSVATGFREGSKQSGLVDGIIYGEALAITGGLTNLAKIAIRRPRPTAYIDAAEHKNDPDYSNADSDSSLSFFSGHAAMVGAVAGTATYLAFTRSPRSVRPWLTLAAGTVLTGLVSFERVRAGAHFPTDVIAGAGVGAGVGVLVAHLHREDTAKQRRVWIGYMPPAAGEGGVLTLNGLL